VGGRQYILLWICAILMETGLEISICRLSAPLRNSICFILKRVQDLKCFHIFRYLEAVTELHIF
jgi:hypothetical protein